MGLQALDTAQQAIPILLRHLSAYLDLAEQDVIATKAMAAARLRAAAVLIVSGAFALLMLCALVIALTWDGDYRVVAIASLAGAFTLTALIALASVMKSRPEAFAALRREWRKDKQFVRGVLSQREEAADPRSAGHAAPDESYRNDARKIA